MAARERRRLTDSRDAEARDARDTVAGAFSRDLRRSGAVLAELSVRLSRTTRHLRTTPTDSAAAVEQELFQDASAELQPPLLQPGFQPGATGSRDKVADEAKSRNLAREAPLRICDVVSRAVDPRRTVAEAASEVSKTERQILEALGITGEGRPFEDVMVEIEARRIASHVEAEKAKSKAKELGAGAGTGPNAATAALAALEKRLGELEETRDRLRALLPLLRQRKAAEQDLRAILEQRAKQALAISGMLSAEIFRASSRRSSLERAVKKDLAALLGHTSEAISVAVGGSFAQSGISSLMAVDWNAWRRRSDPMARDSWLCRQVFSRLSEWRVPWCPRLVPWLYRFLNELAAERLAIQQRGRKESTLSRRTVPVESIAEITADISMCCRHHDQSTVSGEWIPALSGLSERTAAAAALCEEVRTLAHEWWVQPAQFTTPTITVDDIPFDRWASLWREISERLQP